MKRRTPGLHSKKRNRTSNDNELTPDQGSASTSTQLNSNHDDIRSESRSSDFSDEEDEIPEKRQRMDPDQDPDPVYSTGYLKLTASGTYYQSRIIGLCVLQGRNKKKDFRLATEMNAAGKIDDVAFKWYDELEEKWIWRFFQVKHKLNPANKKTLIKVCNLQSKDHDFSLNKIFNSCCKMNGEKIFKGNEFYEFAIVVNADFDHDNLSKNKWDNLIEEDKGERRIDRDEILNFKMSKFKAKKYKFKNEAKETLSNLFKYYLFQSVKDIFDTIEKDIKNIPEEYKQTQNKKNVNDSIEKGNEKKDKYLKIANKLLSFKTSKTFNTRKISYAALKKSIEKLEMDYRGRPNDLASSLKMAVKNISSVFNKLKKKYEEIKPKIDENEEYFKKSLSMKKEEKTDDEIENKKNKNPLSELSVIHLAFDDKAFETELDNFIKKFRIVVNFPDFDEMDGFVKKVLSEEFKIENVGLPSKYFDQCMFDILKEYNQKDGTAPFYSWKKADDLFEYIKKQINIYRFSGINLPYSKKLNSYNVSFETERRNVCFEEIQNDVKKFLSQNENKVLHISTECTLLSAIKLNQILKNLKQIKQFDGYFFVPLSRESPIDKDIISSFSLNEANNLFAIVCEDENESEENTKRFEDLSKIIRDDSAKKVILIKNGNIFFKECVQKLEDKSSFIDLNEKSQENLLQTKIDFGNKSMELNRIINDKSAVEIFNNESLLLMLVKKQNISFELKKCFNSNPDAIARLYYIPRKLYRDTEEHVTSSHDQDASKSEESFDDDSEESFDDDSEGSFDNQVASVSAEYDEEHFASMKNKTVLIADHSGKGKTTFLAIMEQTLNSYDSKCIENPPIFWVIRITLYDYAQNPEDSTSLSKIYFGENDTEEAIDFLCNMVIPENSNNITFLKELIKFSLTDQKGDDFKKPKFVIMFDGFDEIVSAYQSNTINLIKALQKSAVTQLWVTTRNDEKEELEKELKTSAYIMKEFTGDEQLEFLSKFFQLHLEFKKGPNKEYIKRTTDEIEEMKEKNPELNNLSDFSKKLLKQCGPSFTNNPLHIHMLGTVVVEYHFKMPKNFGLFDLYKKFVESMFKRYTEDKERTKPDTKTYASSRSSSLYDEKEAHTELAVRLFFPVECKKLPDMNCMEKYKKKHPEYVKIFFRIGLVTLSGQIYHFLHRNYAEYLFAKYVYEHLGDELVQSVLLISILYRDNFELTRRFLNELLTEKSDKKNNKHHDLCDRVKDIICKNLFPINLNKIILSETSMRDIADQGLDNILDFIFENISAEEDLFEKLLLSMNKILQAAITQNHSDFVNKLLNYGLKSKESFRTNLLYNCGGIFHNPIKSAMGNYPIFEKILNFFLKHFNEEFTKEYLYKSIDEDAHWFQDSIFPEEIKLTEKCLKWMKNKLGEEFLYKWMLKVIVYSNNIMVDIILQILNVFETKIYIEDLIIIFVYRMRPNEFENLITKAVEIDEKLKPIINVIRSNVNEVPSVRLKLDKFIETKNYDEVKRILIESKPDRIKCLALTQNELGQTVLHKAAEVSDGECTILKHLLSSIAKHPNIFLELVSKTDKFERTALHVAAEHGCDKYISTLLEALNRLDEINLKNVFSCNFFSVFKIAKKKNHRKTILTILKFVAEHLPVILEKQMFEIGGLETDELTEEIFPKNTLKLIEPIQNKINLIKAAEKDGNENEITEILDNAKTKGYHMKLLHTEIEIENPFNSASDSGILCLLIWVNGNIKEDPPVTLEKCVLSFNGKILKIQFLEFVIKNLGQATLKELFMESITIPIDIWHWTIENKAFDDEHFEGFFNFDPIAFHFAKKIIKDVKILPKLAENRYKIFENILLTKTDRGQIILDYTMAKYRKHRTSILETNVKFLKNKYDEIVVSFLNSNENAFDNEQLEALEVYVKRYYDKENKKQVLKKINDLRFQILL